MGMVCDDFFIWFTVQLAIVSLSRPFTLYAFIPSLEILIVIFAFQMFMVTGPVPVQDTELTVEARPHITKDHCYHHSDKKYQKCPCHRHRLSWF